MKKTHVKMTLALLLALCLAFTLAACSAAPAASSAPAESSAPAQGDTPAESSAPAEGGGDSTGKTVGISMPTKALERWNRDGDYLDNQFKQAGYNTIVTYSDNKNEQQVTTYRTCSRRA